MKTPASNFAARALLFLALSLNGYLALGQVGVWVGHQLPYNTNTYLSFNSLASSADGTKLVVTAADGSGHHLFTSTDSGATWTLRDNGVNDWTCVASSADGNKLIACYEQVWLSTDAGANWNQALGFPQHYDAKLAVASSADGAKLCVFGQYPYLSTNSGATWISPSWPSTYLGRTIASSADGTKLAITTGDHIYTSTDSGMTWTARGVTKSWGDMASSADGTNLVALGTGGGGSDYVFKSIDAGVTWVQVPGTLNKWARVASSADGSRLIATAGGTNFLSTDGGVNWSASGPADKNFYVVATSADGMKFAAGANGLNAMIYTYIVPLANDQCSGAIALSSGATYTMTTTYATSTSDPTPSCQANFGNGVWFKYTPSGNGPVLISTCGSGFDTVLQVFTGNCGSLSALACNDDYGPACSGSRQASLSFSGAAGTTYYILAGGYGSSTGTLQITAQTLNDQCSGAIALTAGTTYSMSTGDATSTGDPTPSCGAAVGKGVWFSYTPATSRVVKIDTCGSDFDTVLQVYTGSCGLLTPVAGACNDDSNVCPGTRQSSVGYTATAGTVYYILVGGYNGANGNLDITASEVPIAITSQPIGGAANSGDSHTFSVAAVGLNLTYQWQFGAADSYGATSPSFTVSDLDPTMAGNYRVVITNVYGAVTSSVAALSVDPALALALETTSLTWTTGGGNGAWYRETLFTHDAVDAARCIGSISSPPWLQTTVTGPGTLSFYWGFVINIFDTTSDYLGLQVDGVEVAKRNASRFTLQFYQQTIYLTSGSHTLKWVYDRNGGDTGGSYLDQVSYTSGTTAAFIATQPIPQSTIAGSNATFTVGASGTPPFTYQWLFNGNVLSNANSSSLTLTNVQPVQGSNYSVIVANGYGSPVTSSIVALTVTTIALPVALDYAGPAWSTSGNAQWFGQVGVTHDGVDAVQSGWVTNNQQCTLTANLIGPGNLSFWWKVSSETNWDYIRFYTNGVYRTNISGEVGWQQQSVSLPAGKQTVSWVYSKDVSLSYGQDAGWVDQVTYDGPPYLSVTPLAKNQVILWWPYSVTGCTLQKTTNLMAPVIWQNVPDTSYWVDDNWVVTNTTSSSQLFYRLKK